MATQEVPLKAFSWEKQTYWLFCETDTCNDILRAAQGDLIQLQVMQYISFLSDSKDILDTVIIAAPNQNITCLNGVEISLSERSLKVLFTLNTRSCLPFRIPFPKGLSIEWLSTSLPVQMWRLKTLP